MSGVRARRGSVDAVLVRQEARRSVRAKRSSDTVGGRGPREKGLAYNAEVY